MTLAKMVVLGAKRRNLDLVDEQVVGNWKNMRCPAGATLMVEGRPRGQGRCRPLSSGILTVFRSLPETVAGKDSLRGCGRRGHHAWSKKILVVRPRYARSSVITRANYTRRWFVEDPKDGKPFWTVYYLPERAHIGSRPRVDVKSQRAPWMAKTPREASGTQGHYGRPATGHRNLRGTQAQRALRDCGGGWGVVEILAREEAW